MTEEVILSFIDKN